MPCMGMSRQHQIDVAVGQRVGAPSIGIVLQLDFETPELDSQLLSIMDKVKKLLDGNGEMSQADVEKLNEFVQILNNDEKFYDILETNDELISMEEGCLSVPGIHEKVKRPSKVKIKYLDENLTPHEEWVDGFVARVIQHEFDHLEGKMFVARVSPLRKQLLKNKLIGMTKGKFNCHYKVRPNH